MHYLQYILHHIKNVIADNEYLQNKTKSTDFSREWEKDSTIIKAKIRVVQIFI